MMGRLGFAMPPNAGVEAMPLYGDLPDSTGNRIAYRAAESQTHTADPQDELYRFVDMQMQVMREYRRQYSQDWDYYYAIVQGKQWVKRGYAASAGTETSMAPWRARFNINYTWAIMDARQATVFDVEPKITLHATSSEQQAYWDQVQAAVDQVHEDQEVIEKAEEATTNAQTYGNGYMKGMWNPDAVGLDGTRGRVEWWVVPTENLFVDKTCGSFEDVTRIAETQVVPFSWAVKRWPEKAAAMRADARLGSFAENKRSTAQADWGILSPQIYSPGGEEFPLGDSAEASMRPGQSQGDLLCEKVEFWMRDRYSLKEETVQEVAGHDLYGQPVYAARTITKLAFPNWRLTVTCGGVVVEDSAQDILPYVLFRDRVRPREFYGGGVVELTVDQQLEINKSRSQMMDNANAMFNSFYIADMDCGIQPNQIMNVPGAIYMVRPQSRLERVTPPDMPAGLYQRPQLAIQDMFTIAGVNGAGNQAPRGVRSGAGMQEAQAFQTQRIRRLAKRIEKALRDIGRITVQLIQRHYTTPRMIRIRGKMGEPAFVPFDGWHARGMWDVAIETSAATASTKTAREQQAIQLYTLGVIDDVDLLDKLGWPDRAAVLQRKRGYNAPQVVMYPGYPGTPDPSRGDTSGYSLAVRAQMPHAEQPPAPTGIPSGAPPPGAAPRRAPRAHKPKGPGAAASAFGMNAFGPHQAQMRR